MSTFHVLAFFTILSVLLAAKAEPDDDDAAAPATLLGSAFLFLFPATAPPRLNRQFNTNVFNSLKQLGFMASIFIMTSSCEGRLERAVGLVFSIIDKKPAISTVSSLKMSWLSCIRSSRVGTLFLSDLESCSRRKVQYVSSKALENELAKW